MPVSTTSPVYSPAIGSTSLPLTLTAFTSCAPQRGEHRVLDVGGLAFFDDQDRFLAGAERDDLVRHHRVGHVHAVDRHLARTPKASARPSVCSARITALYMPPWQMMPMSFISPSKSFVQLVFP